MDIFTNKRINPYYIFYKITSIFSNIIININLNGIYYIDNVDLFRTVCTIEPIEMFYISTIPHIMYVEELREIRYKDRFNTKLEFGEWDLIDGNCHIEVRGIYTFYNIKQNVKPLPKQLHAIQTGVPKYLRDIYKFITKNSPLFKV